MLINKPHILVKVSFSSFYLFNMQKSFHGDGEWLDLRWCPIWPCMWTQMSLPPQQLARDTRLYTVSVFFLSLRNKPLLDSRLLCMVCRVYLEGKVRVGRTFTCSFPSETALLYTAQATLSLSSPGLRGPPCPSWLSASKGNRLFLLWNRRNSAPHIFLLTSKERLCTGVASTLRC